MGSWDYSIFWKEALNQFKSELTEQEFSMWFNIEYETSGESSLLVSVPSAFYRDQVKQRYQNRIEAKLFELSGQHIDVEFEVKPRKREESPAANKPVQRNESTFEVQRSTYSQPPQGGLFRAPRETHPQLRKDYTFDSFVIGENNSFAANAAIAIAKNPGTLYNPCLIYGGVGLGKTHLMQAIGNMAWKERDCKIIYITAENFTNEFVESIKNNKTQDFKNKYRKTDMLLIDDIHFLQRKTKRRKSFSYIQRLIRRKQTDYFTCDRPVSNRICRND